MAMVGSTKVKSMKLNVPAVITAFLRKKFLEWKEKEEMTNNVYFSRRRGDKEGKSTKYR